jgi:four helix bundle protein
MTNGESAQPERRKVFDLEERTARFGEAVIGFVRQIAIGPVTEPIIRQLVNSATSVGANYCEADDSGSKKEFRYRISLCKRESREAKHWLRISDRKEEARALWREAKELNLIFAAIFRGKKSN